MTAQWLTHVELGVQLTAGAAVEAPMRLSWGLWVAGKLLWQGVQKARGGWGHVCGAWRHSLGGECKALVAM